MNTSKIIYKMTLKSHQVQATHTIFKSSLFRPYE